MQQLLSVLWAIHFVNIGSSCPEIHIEVHHRHSEGACPILLVPVHRVGRSGVDIRALFLALRTMSKAFHYFGS